MRRYSANAEYFKIDCMCVGLCRLNWRAVLFNKLWLKRTLSTHSRRVSLSGPHNMGVKK